MKEILPGIFTWSWRSPEKGIDFNGWYLGGGDPVIIDPPPCDEDSIGEIERRGVPRAILLTNKDHTRECERFASLFRAPVLIHQADAPLAPTRIGGIFKHGEELPGGLRAVRIPDGKSPGECAFLLRKSNAIIIGDALIGSPPGSLKMLPPEKYPDPERARQGLRVILEYAFDALLLGDGESITSGGRKAVEEFLEQAGG